MSDRSTTGESADDGSVKGFILLEGRTNPISA